MTELATLSTYPCAIRALTFKRGNHDRPACGSEPTSPKEPKLRRLEADIPLSGPCWIPPKRTPVRGFNQGLPANPGSQNESRVFILLWVFMRQSLKRKAFESIILLNLTKDRDQNIACFITYAHESRFGTYVPFFRPPFIQMVKTDFLKPKKSRKSSPMTVNLPSLIRPSWLHRIFV